MKISLTLILVLWSASAWAHSPWAIEYAFYTVAGIILFVTLWQVYRLGNKHITPWEIFKAIAIVLAVAFLSSTVLGPVLYILFE